MAAVHLEHMLWAKKKKNNMHRYTVCLFLKTALVFGSSNGLTNTRCYSYSFVLLMMGGGTTRNIFLVILWKH